ncbi:22513_t:CDS:2 [Rhizophagus irregularis]|nr:22513_t:CDS:2 [Rhizophagus irregularis]
MMVLDHPDSNSSQPPPIPQNSPSIQSIPSISIPSQHLLDDSQVPSGLIPNNLLSTNVSSPCIEAHDHEAQELHSFAKAILAQSKNISDIVSAIWK